MVVNTDANGDFTMPMFERAQAVIALSDQGFARMSLPEFRASPKIRLQAWGRIEGTLHIGHRLATNEIVVLSQARFDRDALFYNEEFQTKTDDQGRFVITYVPPGEQTLARGVPIGNGAWSQQVMGTVIVKAGEASRVELGGKGTRILGKLKSTQSVTTIDWSRLDGNFSTRWPDILQQMAPGKTQEEQMAVVRSAEYKAKVKEGLKHFHQFPVGFNSNGSFAADEVLPGKYDLDIYERFSPMDPRNFRQQTNSLHGEISIPDAGNEAK